MENPNSEQRDNQVRKCRTRRRVSSCRECLRYGSPNPRTVCPYGEGEAPEGKTN